MIPELNPVWKRWEETHAALLECLEQFPEDRFTWRPASKATTAGEIVLHIARAEMGYAMRAAGQPGMRPDLVVTDRPSALATVALGAEHARRTADTLTADDLERVVAAEWHPLGPRVEGPLTALWFLEQMIRHKAYHLGQLWYLTLLLTADRPAEGAP